jgi:hypothetical protein
MRQLRNSRCGGQGLPLWNPGFDGEHSSPLHRALLPHTRGRGQGRLSVSASQMNEKRPLLSFYHFGHDLVWKRRKCSAANGWVGRSPLGAPGGGSGPGKRAIAARERARAPWFGAGLSIAG